MNEPTTANRVARWHLLFGLTFAVLGMCLGIYMAISKVHVQHPTHAHTLLLGFVVSLLYAVVYRLWVVEAAPKLATTQTALHEVGTTILVIGLFLLFGGFASEATLEPFLAVGSLSALGGAILMLYQAARVGQGATAARATAAGPV